MRSKRELLPEPELGSLYHLHEIKIPVERCAGQVTNVHAIQPNSVMFVTDVGSRWVTVLCRGVLYDISLSRWRSCEADLYIFCISQSEEPA